MHISNIKIWNFRKYGTKDNSDTFTNDNYGLNLDFNKGINVLVGENDSGKTAIIDAIKHVVLTQSKEYIGIEEYDFHKPKNKERTKKLKIECSFSGFDEKGKEAAHFLEWINFNKDRKYELKIKLTAEFKNNRIISDIRAGADAEGSALDGNARDLLRATYLKPLRDAEAELTPGYKSRLAQILKSHKIFDKSDDENRFVKLKQKENGETKQHELEKIIEDANKEITQFFDEEIVKKEIKTKLQETLTLFFPDNEILEINKNQDKSNKKKEPTFKIADSDLNSILRKLSLTLEDNKTGLGALNLLFIAAELLLLETERSDSLQLLLIEEIEAHLHAQAQLRLIDYFETKNKGEQQLILTTHSITLASKISLEKLIICKDDKVFPMGHKHTQLEQGDYKFLERFLDATKANLFFARGLIIVEGDTENLLIPTIAEIIERPLHKYGVSIVNVGSTAFKRYAKILLRKDGKEPPLNISVAIISDRDNKTDIEVNKIKVQWNIQKNKIYIPNHKTLEYDIFKSDLSDELIKSVIIANKIKNAENRGNNYYEELINKDENCKFKIPDEINTIFQNLSPEKLTAVYNYGYYFKNNNASKAITSQIFAEILNTNKEKARKAFLNPDKDNPLKYITDAINYATGKSE